MNGGFGVWVYSGGASTFFLAGTFDQRYPTFSPDGGFVAYQSGQPNDENVYIQPFPGLVLGGRFQARAVAGCPGGDRADAISITSAEAK